MVHHPLTRRSSLATLAALGIASALVGPTGPALAQAKPVTLVISNSQWLDALRGKNLWAALLKYRQVAPEVVLEQEAVPSAEYDNRMTTEFGAGQGPDIAIMQEGLFYSIADAGFLVDMTKTFEGHKSLNATNQNGVVNGQRFGIGWQRAVYALIYNKPLLEAGKAKVPGDVDELIASAKAVTAAVPGSVGFTSRHQMTDFGGWFMDFQNWAYGYGVNWVDAKGKLTIDTPEALAAVKAFKAVYDARIIPVGDGMPTQRTRFKEKQVAFSIDNSGGTLNIASGGALPAKDLFASALPFKHPGAHQQIFIAVNANSKNQKAAVDFVRWLAGPEGQQALREASGPDALATDVPVTESFRGVNPWADTFAELAKTSRSTLIPGHEVDTGPIMRSVMEAVEKVILGKVEPEAALAEAQKQVDLKF
jgi:multiple sugar transport system substrate-binding protein